MIALMKKQQTPFFAVLALVFFIANTHAALTITVTEGSGGGSTFEMLGTGVITTNDTTTIGGNLINIGTPDDTFLRPGTGIGDGLVIHSDTAVTPTISLGSAATNRIFVFDANGSGGLNSRIGFGQFSNNSNSFVTGDNASTLNGTYSTTIPFSVFEPGVYNLITGFSDQDNALADIGAITLIIVPEPSTVFYLSFFTVVGLLRRHRG